MHSFAGVSVSCWVAGCLCWILSVVGEHTDQQVNKDVHGLWVQVVSMAEGQTLPESICPCVFSSES